MFSARPRSLFFRRSLTARPCALVSEKRKVRPEGSATALGAVRGRSAGDGHVTGVNAPKMKPLRFAYKR
jgi:hypothetical protein